MFVGVGITGVGENVRVTAGHFFDDPPRHILEFKPTLLAGDLRVKHHLKEQVAQFVPQFRPVFTGDGVGDFVSFLDGVGHDGGVGLLPIPRTAVVWIAQSGHQGQ